MTQKYWLDRWERNDIGFHQNDVNPHLLRYWHTLNLKANSTIFVPLCGKAYDMIWLRNRGHAVLGVELSALAINAFYQENRLTPHRWPNGKFDHYSADYIDILCGDFFDLDKNSLTKISAVYDRASLIALPPEIRQRYAKHMLQILPPDTQILLVSLDYPQSEMQGPPYAITPEEIAALYGHKTEINLLEQTDVLEENPRFQERGLTQLQESVYLLTLGGC